MHMYIHLYVHICTHLYMCMFVHISICVYKSFELQALGAVLGFVDMVDILAYVASVLPPSQEHKVFEVYWSFTFSQMEALELAGRSLLASPIINVISKQQIYAA